MATCATDPSEAVIGQLLGGAGQVLLEMTPSNRPWAVRVDDRKRLRKPPVDLEVKRKLAGRFAPGMVGPVESDRRDLAIGQPPCEHARRSDPDPFAHTNAHVAKAADGEAVVAEPLGRRDNLSGRRRLFR